MSPTSPTVSLGRMSTREMLNSMSRIMDGDDESDGGSSHVNVCADVKLTCRDGVVLWNRFLALVVSKLTLRPVTFS